MKFVTQSVVVQRKRDYRPLMYVVNAPPTLTKTRQRSVGTEKKKRLIIEKGRRPSFQHIYLLC